MKTAVLGNINSVLPFKALGAETFCIETADDFKKAQAQIEIGDFAILFITQKIAKQFEKEIEGFYNKSLPAVLVIPESAAKESDQSLKKIFERALGREI